jgi:Cu2+-exporting ATPase
VTQAATGSEAGAASKVASTKVACSHCGLTVPPGLVEENGKDQFCCHGCRTAYEVIHACGLESYYRLRSGDEVDGTTPAQSTGRRYAEFDDAAFGQMYVRNLPGGLAGVELYLQGVHCGACVWLVERLPRVVEGVIEARLTLHKSLVQVTWDPVKVPLSRVARALDSLGYAPHPARGIDARSRRVADDRRHLWRIAVAGAIAGNVMLMAVAMYGGMFSGMEAGEATLFRYGNMVLGMVSLVWPGRVFFRGALAAIRTRTPHLDLPIALGLTAGGVGGVYNTIVGAGEIYFDSLVVLIFFLLVGRYLQHRQQRRADDALELLYSMTPRVARRVVGAAGEDAAKDMEVEVEETPVEALAVGDVVEILAGESVPADGVVIAGRSSVDEALLTGESAAVAVEAGRRLAAATVNLSATLRLRVEATGQQTRVGQLMELVEQCARRRAPIVQFANRISVGFTVVILVLAAGTWAAWQWIEAGRALDNTVALLIVACPCALGLATPMALAVAIGRGARRRVLIKGGDTLERLAATGTLWLDKTGTLTQGRSSVIAWYGSEAVRGAVLAAEQQSAHPVARAVTGYLLGEGVVAEAGATEIEQTAEGGIAAVVAGRKVLIGNGAFVAQRGVRMTEEAGVWIERCIAAGVSPVCVAVDGVCEAVMGVGDALRPDAAEAVAELKGMGWRVGILSGDHAGVVERVARELGIEAAAAHGGVMPEGKLAVVQESMRSGPVVMVGDGVNDAAALAAASVGMAVHGGAEASLAAADVYLGRPGLGAVVETIAAARRTVRVIHRNLIVSLGYNTLAVGLAMTGIINPLIAAVLMPLSSLSVLGLSIGSRTFGRERS